MRRQYTCGIIAAACVIGVAICLSVALQRQARKNSLNRNLIEAIKRSDTGAVNALLNSGANPNTQDNLSKQESIFQQIENLYRAPEPDRSPPALLVAMMQYRNKGELPPQTIDIVRALLAKGANVNGVNQYGDTSVLTLYGFGISSDPSQLLSVLLSAGANTEATGPGQITALWGATQLGFTASVQVLLEHGAHTDTTDPGGATPLMVAADNGRTGIVNLLLDHGARIEAKNRAGYTALTQACEYHRSNSSAGPSQSRRKMQSLSPTITERPCRLQTGRATPIL